MQVKLGQLIPCTVMLNMCIQAKVYSVYPLSIIQYGSAVIIEMWDFLAQNITQNPVSQYLPGTLVVLVRYYQAQKYIQYYNLKNIY